MKIRATEASISPSNRGEIEVDISEIDTDEILNQIETDEICTFLPVKEFVQHHGVWDILIEMKIEEIKDFLIENGETELTSKT